MPPTSIHNGNSLILFHFVMWNMLGGMFLAGVVFVVLGFTTAMDPLVLASMDQGAVVEGALIIVAAVVAGITSPFWIGQFIQSPVKFLVNEDWIQTVHPGGMLSKSPKYIDTHLLNEVVHIELNEVVTRGDENQEIKTYSARLMKSDGSDVGTLTKIANATVAEQIAHVAKLELAKTFKIPQGRQSRNADPEQQQQDS
tara:strand:- start:2363 stop:2956 length:594 start_codon:yes stop_codon:yes gene_type:complete